MSEVDSSAPRIDPERLLHRLLDEHGSLDRTRVDGRVELFSRASVLLRASRSIDREPTLSSIGREDGVAVRISRRDPPDERFAAASGRGSHGLRWALANARSLASHRPGATAPWATDQGECSDRDQVDRLPSPGELRSWLDRSWELLRADPSGDRPCEPVSAWVEAATTVECIVADGGLAAVRTRTRAWAMARMRASDPAIRTPRPLFVADRSWARLDSGEWAELAAQRRWQSGALAGSRTGRMRVTFTAEAAALLVAGLVRTLHTGPGATGLPVGPGWRVVDDPLAPDALFGGSFDDAGFPTRRRILADGARGIEAADGPGSLRRPSFRDPPQVLPFHPVLEDGPELPGDDGLLVSELAVHPLPDGRWILECDGVLRRSGEWGPAVRGGLISTSPAVLARSCVARVGPARNSHRGVRTPALLFEGLDVHF